MATMMRYLIDEEALVRETVERVPLPEGVELKQITSGTDWTGDPAWRIVFSIAQQPPFSETFLRSLTDLSHAVEDEVISLELGKWPFIAFDDGEVRDSAV